MKIVNCKLKIKNRSCLSLGGKEICRGRVSRPVWFRAGRPRPYNSCPFVSHLCLFVSFLPRVAEGTIGAEVAPKARFG